MYTWEASTRSVNVLNGAPIDAQGLSKKMRALARKARKLQYCRILSHCTAALLFFVWLADCFVLVRARKGFLWLRVCLPFCAAFDDMYEVPGGGPLWRCFP